MKKVKHGIKRRLKDTQKEPWLQYDYSVNNHHKTYNLSWKNEKRKPLKAKPNKTQKKKMRKEYDQPLGNSKDNQTLPYYISNPFCFRTKGKQ